MAQAALEPSTKGPWPQCKYGNLLKLEYELVASLSLVSNAWSLMRPSWAKLLAESQHVFDPIFVSVELFNDRTWIIRPKYVTDRRYNNHIHTPRPWSPTWTTPPAPRSSAQSACQTQDAQNRRCPKSWQWRVLRASDVCADDVGVDTGGSSEA